MKISEFLENFFETTGPIPQMSELGGKLSAALTNDYTLMPDQLKIQGFKERLLKCDEFKNTKKLIILDKPVQKDEDGKFKQTSTIYIDENIEFGETVYLYNIYLGPEEYNTTDLTKPVKDNITVLPTSYSEEDSTPKKGLTIFWSPDKKQDYQDSYNKTEEDFVKEKVIDKVKQAFENMEEYEVRGRRKVAMRLLAESIKPRDKNANLNFSNFQFVNMK